MPRWTLTATKRPVAISLPRLAVLSWPVIGLLSKSQLPERIREPRSNVMRVETARIGQDPQPGLPHGLVLRAHRRVAAAERRAVRGDPNDREPAGLEPGDLRAQDAGARQELLGTKLVRSGSGTGDDVGDAEPEAKQLLLLIRPEQALGEAGAVQGRPEAVPRPGEVVAGGGGVQARVDAGEYDAQAGRDDIGDRPVPGRVEIGPGGSRRGRHRRCHEIRSLNGISSACPATGTPSCSTSQIRAGSERRCGSWSGSPSTMTRSAILPVSTVPTNSPRPSASAAVLVAAVRASV